jgi:hypothetical protein
MGWLTGRPEVRELLGQHARLRRANDVVADMVFSMSWPSGQAAAQLAQRCDRRDDGVSITT